jgi:hypothetical protein
LPRELCKGFAALHSLLVGGGGCHSVKPKVVCARRRGEEGVHVLIWLPC